MAPHTIAGSHPRRDVPPRRDRPRPTWRSIRVSGDRAGRVRVCVADAVVVLGALCLVLGVVAGYVNRTLLVADRFASGVDEVRREPAVSAVLGRSLTDALVRQQPDAVAIRPLVDSVATAVVGSDLLSGPTRAAAVSFQRSLTEPSSSVFVLRTIALARFVRVAASALP